MKAHLLLASAAFGLLASPAVALTISSYDVRHGFTLTPTFGPWGGFLRPTVARWGYAVGPTFARNSMGVVDWKASIHGSAPLPLGGTMTVSQSAAVPWASANSLSSATVAWTGLSYVGQIRAAGTAVVNPPPGQWAHAFGTSAAWAMVRMYGVGPWGWFSWPSFSYTTVSGSASAAEWARPVMRDPVSFVARNLVTGEIRSGTLLTIDYAIERGDGDMNFDSGTLSLTGPAMSGFFTITAPGDYSSLKGTLDLRFRDGFFTSVTATGSFAGLVLPVPGSVANGDFWLGLEPTLPWKIEDLDEDDPIVIAFRMYNAGSTTDPVPEAATWAMLVAGFGLVGSAVRRRHRSLLRA